jgi:transposase
LRARKIEAYVIHPTSIPVSREHRRAKTDRLDAGLLMRALLGWLGGEPKHCSMAAIPTVADEDARRPNREHQMLVQEQTRVRSARLAQEAIAADGRSYAGVAGGKLLPTRSLPTTSA